MSDNGLYCCTGGGGLRMDGGGGLGMARGGGMDDTGGGDGFGQV